MRFRFWTMFGMVILSVTRKSLFFFDSSPLPVLFLTIIRCGLWSAVLRFWDRYQSINQHTVRTRMRIVKTKENADRRRIEGSTLSSKIRSLWCRLPQFSFPRIFSLTLQDPFSFYGTVCSPAKLLSWHRGKEFLLSLWSRLVLISHHWSTSLCQHSFKENSHKGFCSWVVNDKVHHRYWRKMRTMQAQWNVIRVL